VFCTQNVLRDLETKRTDAIASAAALYIKREALSVVAARGAALYYAILQLGSVQPLYVLSLGRFMELLDASLVTAEKSTLISRRTAGILSSLTQLVCADVFRGVFQLDAPLFPILAVLRIMEIEGHLPPQEVDVLLQRSASAVRTGNAAVDPRRKPLWLPSESWTFVCNLADGVPFFRTLSESLTSNDTLWRRWFEEPEVRGTVL
jgi:hypothetical protein